MSTTATGSQGNAKGRRYTSEAFLGSLVAILSILTAIAAYHGALLDAQAGDHELNSIRNLTESNTEYISANQDIMEDFRVYDNYVLAEDEERVQYYQSGFSEALVASLERPDGPFDDAYYDEQHADANTLYAEALDRFDKTEKVGGQADRIQLVVLIFALGLSFAAWASLADEEARMRVNFSILAIVTGIGGIIVYATIILSSASA